MQEIDKVSHKYSEGWSEKELETKQKLSTKLTILTLLFAIALIVVSIVFFNKYSLSVMSLVLLSGVFSLLLCGLIFYWFNSTQVVEKEEYQIRHQVLEVDQKISVLVFLCSFVNILYNSFLLVYVIFWYRIGKDFYISRALANGVSPDIYMGNYRLGLYFAFPLLIIMSLMLMYVAFTCYITILQKTKLRVGIYFFSLTTILIASFALFYTSQSLTDLGNPFSPVIINSALQLFQVLAVLIIITAFIAFVATFIYRHSYFETIGYFNLILIFLVAGASYGVIRQSEQTRSLYINQCPQQMRNTKEDWIKSNASCDKYTSSLQCDPQNQAVYWEKDNTQKCLNVQCCNAFADSISINIFYAGFSILLLVISGFALSMTLLQVDTSVTAQIEPNRTADWLFVLLAIVTLVLSLLLICSTSTKLPQQDNIIVASERKIELNTSPLVFPTGIENVTGCQPFIDVYKKLNNNKDIELTGQSRVTILAPKMQVVVTEYINSDKISYIPVLILKNILYTTANENTDGMFGVQGDPEEVKKILENHIQICGSGVKNIQTDIYKLQAPQTRQLWTKHTVHDQQNSQATFTDAQKNYIKNLKFTDLTIDIKDIKTGEKLNDVVLYFYKNEDDCGKIKSIPSRMSNISYILVTLDQDSTLYNMVVKEYYFGAEKKGYYLYCNKFQNTEQTTTIDFTMIPRSTQPGQFTVVLETPKHDKFNIILGASYIECTVGFFNGNCGGMQFYGSDNAQAIYVNQLAERDYTFFVYFDPIDANLKELNIKKSQGQTIDSSTINNDPIFQQIKPIVTLYAQEQERPIIRYSLPQATNLKNEPNLTWLVLCVDGSIGDISQSSPAQFWNYAASPTKYQRAQDSKDIYPKICSNI